MDAVNRNIHLLLNLSRRAMCTELTRNRRQSWKKSGTGLESAAFPVRYFRLQNEERGNLLQDAEQLARESAELRRNPEVNAYLDAELALCRMMQQICKTLTDGIEIKVPEI